MPKLLKVSAVQAWAVCLSCSEQETQALSASRTTSTMLTAIAACRNVI